MKEYNYWGSGNNEPPAHLKTQKQLAELGLKPVNPVGYIETRKYTIKLYDPNDLNSVKPKRQSSESQKKALAKGRESQKYKAWYKREGYMIERFWSDQNQVTNWARNVFSFKQNYVALDCETTGLSSTDEAIQIAITDLDGNCLLNSLIKATIPISQEAYEVHKISNDDLVTAPTFPEIYPAIVKALKGKRVLIYNVEFDIKILKHCCQLHKLPLLNLVKRSDCMMQAWSQFVGEWSSYYEDYKYQPLGGNHDALGDCLLMLERLKKMAQTELIDVAEAVRKAYYS